MKASDWFSERMVFGLLIIVGLDGLLFELISFGPKLPPEIITLAAGGIGALSASVGIIVQAIWKVDKTDKVTADTAAVLAAKAPDLSGNGLRPPTPVVVTNDPSNAVPVDDTSKSFMEKPV